MLSLLIGLAHAAVLHCGDGATLQDDVFPQHLQNLAGQLQVDRPVTMETRDRRLVGATLHPTEAGLESLVATFGYSMDGGRFQAVKEGALPISWAHGVLRIGQPPATDTTLAGTCVVVEPKRIVSYTPAKSLLRTRLADDPSKQWTPIDADPKLIHADFDILGMNGLAPADLDDESNLDDFDLDRGTIDHTEAGPMEIHHTKIDIRKKVMFEYPKDADGLGDAKCIAQVEVDKRGRLAEFRVEDCPEAFHAGIGETLKKWKWYPYEIDGEPTPVMFKLMVRFSAP